jgi:hypothetical protein
MTSVDTFIEGFIYLFSNTVFGSTILFMFFFILILGLILLISRCSFEQVFIFLLIPVYSAKDTLLTGIMGISFLAVLGFINGYFLFNHITKFTKS